MTDLSELDPLLRLIARERVGAQTWLLEDAEQEARIAAWTRLEEGHSPGIAVHKAKQAVIDVARGGRQTGSKSSAGHVDTHRRSTSIFKESDEGEYVYEPPDDDAAVAFEQIALRDALQQALGSLTDDQRALLGLLFYEGLTHAEAATRLGITRQAVSLRAKRIYGTLRANLEL